jgi:H+/Cl- antiporter ClcA
MHKYFKYYFPQNLKTYIALLSASIVTIVAIIIFLEISHITQQTFKSIIVDYPLYGVLTPLMFVLLAYLSRYKCHFVGGSGIPQTLAALQSHNKKIRSKLLSFRIAVGKIFFICVAILFGAPVGIEGPSIHIGGAIFYHFARSVAVQRKLFIHTFIAIGSSVGILATVNTPIAALLFAFEETGRNLKKQAKIVIAITVLLVFVGLTIMRDNIPYLGSFAPTIAIIDIWKLLPMAIVAGILGGVFTKLTLQLMNYIVGSIKKILLLVFMLGSIIALLNYMSDGLIAGSGHRETLQILAGENFGIEFFIMKFLATLSSVISAIPGGVFMPNITIGASLGSSVVELFGEFLHIEHTTIIILSMIAYLSAAMRIPITATVMILEMTTSLHLLIPGLIIALVSNYISSKIHKQSLFSILAEKFSYEKS